jgi:hypothetical protein
MLVEGGPDGIDQRRQRVGEVTVAAIPEAMARHVDRRAKPGSVEQVGKLPALLSVQDLLGDSESALVELVTEALPVQGVNSLVDGDGGW